MPEIYQEAAASWRLIVAPELENRRFDDADGYELTQSRTTLRVMDA